MRYEIKLIAMTLGMVVFILSGSAFAEIITLSEAKTMALEHNFDIKDLRENVLQSEITIQRAWAYLLPSIKAQGVLTRNDKEIRFPSDGQLAGLKAACDLGDNDSCNELAATKQVTMQELWGKNAGISGEMSLFTPQSIPAIMAAYESNAGTIHNSKHLQSELLFGVTSAYYAIIQAGKLVAIAKQAVTRAHEHLRSAKNKLEIGKGVRLQVLRAELDLAESEKQLSDADNAHALALQSLGFLVGLNGKSFEVTEPGDVQRPPSIDLDKLLGHAASSRLDLKAAHNIERSGELAALQAWMTFLPSFFMQAQYNWTSASGFSNDNTSWNLMFIASLPLFESGTRIADVRERRSQHRMAQTNVQRTEESVANGVREALLRLTQAESSRKASQKQFELARENYQLVGRQFKVGMTDNLTLLDASTALFQAEQQLAREELSYNLALLTLRQRSGYYVTQE